MWLLGSWALAFHPRKCPSVRVDKQRKIDRFRSPSGHSTQKAYPIASRRTSGAARCVHQKPLLVSRNAAAVVSMAIASAVLFLLLISPTTYTTYISLHSYLTIEAAGIRRCSCGFVASKTQNAALILGLDLTGLDSIGATNLNHGCQAVGRARGGRADGVLFRQEVVVAAHHHVQDPFLHVRGRTAVTEQLKMNSRRRDARKKRGKRCLGECAEKQTKSTRQHSTQQPQSTPPHRTSKQPGEKNASVVAWDELAGAKSKQLAGWPASFRVGFLIVQLVVAT